MISHPPSAEDHRGFAQVGVSMVSQGIWDHAEVQQIRDSAPAEQKELYEMGNPYSDDDRSKNPYPNRWLPENIFPGFRAFIEKWWDTCVNQELQILRYLCEILNVPDRDYLANEQTPDANRSHLSFLHYLSMPLSPLRSRNASRLNAHTDFGQVTLLFQDQVGGLEVHDYKAGIYRPVLPKPGTIIIHIGDMLEKQSNGRWKSALHHVTAPPMAMYGELSEDSVVERYSIAFYAHPDFDTMIRPLPGCEKVGKWRTLEWEPNMTAGDWLNKRVALEYEQHQKQEVGVAPLLVT